MLLVDIVPRVEARRFAKIPAKTPIRSVIEQLRQNDLIPLLIEPSPETLGPRVVSGYSLVSKIAQLPSSRFGPFLDSPASESSLAIGSIDENEDLVSLLHVFEATTIGFAEVLRNNRSTELIISVKNLLELYNSGILSSSLILDDVVSSPVFSLSRGTKLAETLRDMLNRKFRRVQIQGTRVIISDREILSFLFSEERLRRAIKSPERLLDGTLEEIDEKRNEAYWLDGKKNLREAASVLSTPLHDTILSDRGLITPWDLIIKPWRLGELKIASEVPK